MLGDQTTRLMEQGVIEVAPLAFMRGRTLTRAFVILDEAQNTTGAQMKMFLTRLGEDSRMVVTGDPSQSDLPGGRAEGLNEALSILEGVEGVGVARFSKPMWCGTPSSAASSAPIIGAANRHERFRHRLAGRRSPLEKDPRPDAPAEARGGGGAGAVRPEG